MIRARGHSMLGRLWNKLFGRNDDYMPHSTDRETMEGVRARLKMAGGLQQSQGTVIRSIPGVIVEFFLQEDGAAHATVFDKDDRVVGRITPEGEIVYIRPSA